ncbi:MAG: DUF1194 domain-containing protein [Rhodobacter sp.]|nr:DUF1194 domain-containing protein [Rhodobacter sp.]
MRALLFSLCLVLLASHPARSCGLALVLAVDVSGSVDPREYDIQMQGLAEALRDPVVSEALVLAEAAIMLVQWTGSTRQVVSVPWTRTRSFEDIEALAVTVDGTQRKWRNFSTAVGEALDFAREQFAGAPACERKVIDVSGDGVSNEGIEPRALHAALRAENITVNALAIEASVTDLTAYFWENVITGEGAFVATADSFDDYPARIRQKLIRETTKQLACAAPTCRGADDEG